MTAANRGLKAKCAAVLAGLALSAPLAAWADLPVRPQSRTFAERAVMRMADQRCKLFDPGTTLALRMGEDLARNAVLRAGADAPEVANLTTIASQRAASLACNDPVLVSEASRVRTAFAAYAHTQRMTFPGGASSWRADRTVLATRADGGRWALTTAAAHADTPTQFGVVMLAGRLSLFAEPSSSASPSMVRLVFRNIALADRPYLVGALTPPPRSVSTALFAAERRQGPDGGEGFRFPDSAMEALARLDPREAVVLEFVYPSDHGDRITRALYEVGDFAPAVGFLRLPL